MYKSIHDKTQSLHSTVAEFAYSIKLKRDIVTKLEKTRRCTGTLSGEQIVHPAGASCPFHNQPLPPSGRLRLYVRKGDREKVAKAIAQEAEYQIALDHLDQKRKKLQAAQYHLDQALAALK